MSGVHAADAVVEEYIAMSAVRQGVELRRGEVLDALLKKCQDKMARAWLARTFSSWARASQNPFAYWPTQCALLTP